MKNAIYYFVNKTGCKAADKTEELMLKRVISILLIMTLVLGSLMGCTSDKQQTSAPEQTQDNDSKGEDVPEDTKQDTPESTPSKDSLDAETIVWNVGTDTKTWDPQKVVTSDGGNIINNIYEGLLRESSTGFEPGIAESYEISANAEGVEGTVYTFHLRKSKWSDGKDLTAHDFVYGFTRGADSAVASGFSFLVLPYIKGAQAYFDGTGTAEELGVKALDDYTFQVELNFPVSFFIQLMSNPVYMPVREDMVAYGDGWEKDPSRCISNGPYIMTEYKTGSHFMFEKNPNYWDAENVTIQKIKGLMLAETTTAFQGYQAGEIQVLDKLPPDELPVLKAEDPNFKIKPTIGVYYIEFNCDREPTNNKLVRQAISIAIDRTNLTEQVARGGQLPATGVIPPTLTLSDGTPMRQTDENGVPVPQYGIDPNKADAEKAQALLAEAGFPNGEGFPELEYVFNTEEVHKKIAEALQQMWKQNLNINVKLRNEDWAVYGNTQTKGDFDMNKGGWSGDYADPTTLLALWQEDSPNNGARWRANPYITERTTDEILNPEAAEFNKYMEDSMTAQGKERDDLLIKAEDAMMNEMIVAPLYYYTSPELVDSAFVENLSKTQTGNWIFKDAVYAE